MELTALKKKAVLVPTPGQTEQEYLAAYHAGKGLFITQQQDRLDLLQLLTAAEKLPLFSPVPEKQMPFDFREAIERMFLFSSTK
jgi:hypothetical protein